MLVPPRATIGAGLRRCDRTQIAQGGLTILLVEQNTRLALQTAQRAYVLVTGEIVLSGPAAELREDPRIKAAYLGEGVH